MQDLNPSQDIRNLSSQLPTFSTISENRANEFNISSFLAILGRRWWVILGVGLTVASYQVITDLKRPPIYKSNFQLLVQPPEQDITNPLDGAGQILANNRNTGDYFSTQITILLSNKILNPVVDKIHQKYPELKESFDYSTLASRMTISQVNKGQILSISYQDSDPKRVKFVLDQLAKAYLQHTLQEQKLKSQQKLGFITQQLPLLQQRVTFLQQELLKLQQDNNFFDPQAQGGTLNANLNTILQRKQDVEIQIQQNQILSNSLRQQLGSTESQAIALETLSQSAQYGALLSRLNQINMRLAEESTRLTEDNPLIQSLKAERDNLVPLLDQQFQGLLKGDTNGVSQTAPKILASNDIRSNSLKQLLETNAQLATLKKQRQLLSSYEAQVRQELRYFSNIVTQYLNIQRQLNLATESLNRLLAAEQTLEIETSKRFIPWRLITEPTLPTQPIDRFINNLLLAIVKGIIVGGIAGALVEYLDRRYHSPDDVSQDLKVTILGIIPFISELKLLNKKTKKVLNTNFLEAFSVLFSTVFFVRQKQSCHSFIVSSATSGDGKSTVAFFTALAAAKLGQRVLLVDGDRYFPQGKKWLEFVQSLSPKNPTNSSEESEVLVEDISTSQQPLLLTDNLYYFKTPDNALDPDQLMSSQSLLVLLEQWQESYDVILIDTPPLLGLSDARLIASQTDGVVLVIRLDKTRKDHVYSALDSLNIADINVLGVVVNDVKKNSSGYDYGYNYYNRYYRKKAEENIAKTNGSNVIG
jgi:capsular exopolysaccharide synthesis family protein